ncbi:hypothetical protein K8I28_05950 [bacterium]|nr:hypothetical protein [bacterium]
MSDPITTIENLLGKVRRKQLTSWALALLLGGISIVVSIFFIAIVVESIAWFDPHTRVPFVGSVVGISAFAFLASLVIALVFILLKKYPSDESLAREIWNKDSDVRDQILNSLQLARSPHSKSSESLRFAAIANSIKKAEELDPTNYVRREKLNVALKGLGITFGSVILLGVIFFQPFRASADRLANPLQSYLKPGTVLLQLDMADTLQVIQGESIELAVRATNSLPRELNFLLSERAGVSRNIPAIQDSSDSSRYIAKLKQLERSFQVVAHTLDSNSDTSWVEVLPRPRIARLNISVLPPAYTGLETIHLPEGVGDFAALPGSHIYLKAESNRSLSRALLYRETRKGKVDSTVIAAEGRLAKGDFRIAASGNWWLQLYADDGISSDNPLKWNIDLLEDYPPQVEVRKPEDGAEIPQSLVVPLVVIADDDFGISKMNLRFRIYNELTSPDSVGDEYYNTVPLQGEQVTAGRVIVQSAWNLQTMPLLPTDEVHYFVEVWDNDAWHGNKYTRTELRKLVFPSIEDMFTRAAEEEQDATDEIIQSLEEAKKVKEKLEQTLERLKSNPENLSWEEKVALEQSLETQKQIMEQMEAATETLEQLQQQFAEHDMVTMEMMEKYAKLQELLEEVASPEMKKAMEELQKALEEQDGEAVREALENMMMNQEEFIERMDRSMAILEQLKQERRLEELATRAQELAERQKNLSERMEDADSQDQNRLDFEQKQVAEDYENLMEDLEKTADDMVTASPEYSDSLNSLHEEFAEKNLEQGFQQTRNEMQNNQMKQASKSAKKSEQELQKMAQSLQKMNQGFKQQNKNQLTEEMDYLYEELLVLSRRQEELRNQSESLGVSSPRYRALAAQQNGLLQSLDVIERQLAEISKETFFVGASIAGEIGVARQRMGDAIDRYTGRRPREVSGEQQAALAAIHRSILRLGQARDNMQQSGSGTGYQEMMEQLQQMASQQQGINEGTQGMPTPMPRPGSMPGGDQLSQMAAQQRALAQAMQEMEKQSQSMEEMLGSLDGMGKSMHEVAKDMENRNVTDRTRQLQKRILQRLLDTQRSLQQRELSRKRQSQSGAELFGNAPDALRQEREDMLRARMLQALDAGYAQPWRPVIRDYFKALEKETVADEKKE